MKKLFASNAVNSKMSTYVNSILRIAIYSCIILSAGNVYSQNKFTVTGTVTDNSSGESIPGLTVVEKGTSNGTITDFDGNYSINVSDKLGSLVFSFIGMETQEVAINNRSTINIIMAGSTVNLEEVVAIGYGTVKKSDLTGSVASVSVEDLKKVPVTSLDQSLQGRISGVQVTQVSAQPGGATSIRIRGGNSIVAGNEPLYIIDGVQVMSSNNFSWIGGPGENALSSLNPSDIESMSVLKDASATSIYGARGSNGVVLITTKRGKSGNDKITFDAYFGIQEQIKAIEVMNATQFAKLYDEAGLNATPNGSSYDPLYPDPESLGSGTDWQDQIYRTAPMQNYQLTFSGGDDKTNYALSGNYFSQDGIIVGSDFDRYSGRINLDRKVTSKLKTGTSLSLTNTNSNTVGSSTPGGFFPGVVNTAIIFNPTLPIYDETGQYTLKDPIADGWLDNPVAVTKEVEAISKVNRIMGNIYAQYDINSHLKLKISGGLDSYKNTQDMYTPRFIYSGSINDGQARFAVTESSTYLNENTLTYNKTINDIHKITFLGGFTYQKTNSRAHINISTGFPSDNLGYQGIADFEDMPTILASFTEEALISYLGRANYSLQEKYLFTLTGRTDGSSKFGKSNRFAFFPSLAFAWRLSEENFIKNLNTFSALKLRTSIGTSGNEKIPMYQNIATLNSTMYYFNNSTPASGYTMERIGNDNLKWETTQQFDFGLDMGFFNGRISLTTDYYYKKTLDLLYWASTPYTSGFEKALLNVGTMQNKGFEFTANTQNFVGEFDWSTNFNISFNKNKILSLNENEDLKITNDEYKLKIGTWSIVREGEEMGTFYGYEADGIWQLGEETEAAKYNKEPGDFKYIDQDNNGKIDAEDRKIIGHALPQFTWSLNNTFSYKNFELTAFIQGVYGNDILNSNRFELESGNGLSNASINMLDRWTPENPSNVYPRANQDAKYLEMSDRYLEDGSYIRLKTLTLSYQIPMENAKLLKIKNAKVYVSGKNLLTLTKYSGFDPEVGRFGQDNTRQGYDYGGYPSAKVFLVGINLSFL
ncbi:MAG: TonB-dependent receptor [Salinivirgaceae bacterium]|nr:TonB-dependent receptor [Salinivirgaceae bacterium]